MRELTEAHRLSSNKLSRLAISPASTLSYQTDPAVQSRIVNWLGEILRRPESASESGKSKLFWRDKINR